MRRQMQLAVYAVSAMLTLGIVGCGGGNSEDNFVEKYVDCLKAANFYGMRQMSTGDMLAWLDRAEQKYREIEVLLGEKTAAKFKDTYDELKYEIGYIPPGDAKKTIMVKINGQNTPMTLVNVDGKWRIEKFDFPII